MPSRRQASSLPCPVHYLAPRSVRIGTLKLRVLMLSAICRICYCASAAMSPAYPLSADRVASRENCARQCAFAPRSPGAGRQRRGRNATKQTVPHRLDEPAVRPGDFRIEELTPKRLEAFERAFLVCSHQPRISRHIGGEDGGETADLAHVISPTAKRRPAKYSSRCSGLRQCVAFTIRGVMARKRPTISRASSSHLICA